MKRLVKIAAAAFLIWPSAVNAQAVDKKAILTNYADIAHAVYEDSLVSGKTLQAAVAKFIAAPTTETMKVARDAWLAARVPYQQSEAYRFGNPNVDDWEGKVNAWPLDEGLIDYVAESYGTDSGENPLYTANVIANKRLKIGGKNVDASRITKRLLPETLHEAGKVEANVATGYHAIEFLLWGQDLNGTGPGAGNRPATDYDKKDCTGGNCDRRAAYLKTVTALLVDDLQDMVKQWGPRGKARAEIMKEEPNAGITRIITGIGSLSYGELAGERMKLGLLLHDPEEEHDCFSDNTHNSHYYDAKGVQNVYLGRYVRINGKEVKGAGLSDLVAAKDAAMDKEMKSNLDDTMVKMQVLVDTAKGGEAYDQMIGDNNAAGNSKVQGVIDALVAQTRTLEKIVAGLALGDAKFEGSESLDDPSAVGKK